MLSALQLLTILPLPAAKSRIGSGAWAFPIVGATLGLLCAAILPLKLGAILALVAVILISGGLHEDGLADVCDAVRAHRTRERMHAILKDSRVGAHGALALITCFVLRWQALAQLSTNRWQALVAVYGLSRAQMVVLAACGPATGEGLGLRFASTLPSYSGIIVGGQAVLLAALVGWPLGATLLAVNAALLLLTRHWFIARLGGITGDCLGFLCVVSETVSLIVVAWNGGAIS